MLNVPNWKKLKKKVSIFSEFKAYGKSLMTYLFPPTRKLKSSHTPFPKVFQSHSTFTTDSHNTLKMCTVAIDFQTRVELSRKKSTFLLQEG